MWIKASVLVVFICFLIIGLSIIYPSNDIDYEVKTPLSYLDEVEDRVERKSQLRHYWGKKLTHSIFKKMFGVEISDQGIIRYSLQAGSVNEAKSSDAIATAYFIGVQKIQNETQIESAKKSIKDNYSRYYSGQLMPESEADKYIDSVLNDYFPAFSGQYSGVYLISKNDEVYADFNGIHLPINMTLDYLDRILVSVKPSNSLNVGVY